MKGKTQFPQLVVFEDGYDVDTGDGLAVDGEGEGVEPLSLQEADSSPREAKENLFCVMTWALSDRSATPVAVWETG